MGSNEQNTVFCIEGPLLALQIQFLEVQHPIKKNGNHNNSGYGPGCNSFIMSCKRCCYISKDEHFVNLIMWMPRVKKRVGLSHKL